MPIIDLAKHTHLTLKPGEISNRIPSQNMGKRSHISLVRGVPYPIVPDDSRFKGIGLTLAQQMLDDGKAVLCDENATPLPEEEPETPADSAQRETVETRQEPSAGENAEEG